MKQRVSDTKLQFIRDADQEHLQVSGRVAKDLARDLKDNRKTLDLIHDWAINNLNDAAMSDWGQGIGYAARTVLRILDAASVEEKNETAGE